MKKRPFKTGLIFASWAMLLIFGCHKKKPDIPGQQPPPTISTTTPQETPPAPAPQEPQNPQTTPEQPQTTSNDKPPEKPSPRHPKRTTPPPVKKPAAEPEKPATSEIAKNSPPPSPPRIVIQEGSTTPNGTGKIGSANDAQSQATTQQLIDSTENNLRNLKRTLSADEQTTVKQIQDYLKQSKDATKDGDLSRAHNLALKARLLSDELVKTK